MANPQLKSAKPKRTAGVMLLAPFTWPAKAAAWLTSKPGFQIVLYISAGYCLALAVETVYTAMPRSGAATAAGVENVKFLPKPAIQDNARLSLISPLPIAGNLFLIARNNTIGNLPFAKKTPVVWQWTVWNDSHFYVAMVIALLIQGIEAKAMRRVKGSWERKSAKFKELNSRKVPEISPEAIVAARVAQADLQTEGLGSYAGTAFVISGVYVVEFWTFIRSIAGLEIGLMTMVLYALINVFGFELCLSLAQDDED